MYPFYLFRTEKEALKQHALCQRWQVGGNYQWVMHSPKHKGDFPLWMVYRKRINIWKC